MKFNETGLKYTATYALSISLLKLKISRLGRSLSVNSVSRIGPTSIRYHLALGSSGRNESEDERGRERAGREVARFLWPEICDLER